MTALPDLHSMEHKSEDCIFQPWLRCFCFCLCNRCVLFEVIMLRHQNEQPAGICLQAVIVVQRIPPAMQVVQKSYTYA